MKTALILTIGIGLVLYIAYRYNMQVFSPPEVADEPPVSPLPLYQQPLMPYEDFKELCKPYQVHINAIRKAHGLNPIKVDGKIWSETAKAWDQAEALQGGDEITRKEIERTGK